MKVIGAGFSKTGTKSLHTALLKLGYCTVYDALENAVYLEDEWKTIFEKGWSFEIFKKMYENIDAVVDVPAFYFWEDIYNAFPDAKIILTVRENEDVWFKSLKGHMECRDKIFVQHLLEWFSPSWKRTQVMRHNYGEKIYGDRYMFDSKWFGRKMNEQLLKLIYRQHNAYVLHKAPKTKLLVFNVKDGWEPLCKFLGEPVPDEPFPHKNPKGGIVQYWMITHPCVLKMKNEMKITLASILLGAATLLGVLVYSKIS
ncbi:uncharacterized protein LOC144428016 [Styela clava]